jgi:hypothetical protein
VVVIDREVELASGDIRTAYGAPSILRGQQVRILLDRDPVVVLHLLHSTFLRTVRPPTSITLTMKTSGFVPISVSSVFVERLDLTAAFTPPQSLGQ